MHPSPRAETSKLLFPSLRFCIAFPPEDKSDAEPQRMILKSKRNIASLPAFSVSLQVPILRVLIDSRAQQRLDCAALIHRAVALSNLIEGQGQIEDLAGVDLSIPHQVN